ncbi:uncharacterized protein LOC123222642 isoform X1 [Mangifera indica]|uniref:uncharacterized protein LOC123222642 isoform X1 n=1 Tax=Mangifera indica TaxID=29780 RepID=UPI001CFC41CA|nr:uncharacterized protein LOC123222642 isoform X1 [Mangifera indica]
METEESGDRSGVKEIQTHWWWVLASTVQLGWGISSYRKGYSGDSRLMPVKAFGIAALFVGSAASASVASLQASGIHKVEDLMEVGSNIRKKLGIASRTSAK